MIKLNEFVCLVGWFVLYEEPYAFWRPELRIFNLSPVSGQKYIE